MYGLISVRLDAKPDFTVLGVKRPAGGVRLYASRDLDADFQLIDPAHGPVHWRLTTPMHGVLIIDMPDYSAAFARLFEIWANQDREKTLALEREHRALAAAPKAIEGKAALPAGKRGRMALPKGKDRS